MTDPTKVTALTSWKIPETEKELCSFLGLTSYYQRYIKGFSVIAKPLNNLLGGTRKKLRNKTSSAASFVERWNSDCAYAFQELKNKLISAPILSYPDFTQPFILETDASHSGLGAILSQEQDNKKVVIAYVAAHVVQPREI